MNTVTRLTQLFTGVSILAGTLISYTSGETRQEEIPIKDQPDHTHTNVNCFGNRLPIESLKLYKAPVGSIMGKEITLMPMSAARLRISVFPNIKE